MAQPKITLYVDTVSPFGYIGYYLLRNDPVFSNCDITYIPIFLGGLMKMCNNATPISIKNKGTWIGKERTRWAHYFNIPMAEDYPPGFPQMTLGIMRAVCALTVLHPGKEGQGILCEVLDALFKSSWVEGRKTNEKEVLEEVLGGVLGREEAGKVLAMAGKEGKEVLNKNTDHAFQNGGFGLPYFVATNSEGQTECFWGVDHIAQVTQHLGLEKPKTGGWKAVL